MCLSKTAANYGKGPKFDRLVLVITCFLRWVWEKSTRGLKKNTWNQPKLAMVIPITFLKPRVDFSQNHPKNTFDSNARLSHISTSSTRWKLIKNNTKIHISFSLAGFGQSSIFFCSFDNSDLPALRFLLK